MNRIECIVCGNRMSFFATKRDTASCVKLHYCLGCKIGRSTENFDLKIYNAQYFQHYLELSVTPFSKKLMNVRLDTILTAHPGCKSIFDYGTGSMAFINECINRQIECVGFDINPSVQQYLGFDYYKGAEHIGNYDCVSGFDVIAHLSDVNSWLTRVRNWLNPGGVVVISTPYYNSQYDILRSRHWKPSEHLLYFSDNGLDKLMGKHGHTLVSKTEEPGRDRIMLRVYR